MRLTLGLATLLALAAGCHSMLPFQGGEGGAATREAGGETRVRDAAREGWRDAQVHPVDDGVSHPRDGGPAPDATTTWSIQPTACNLNAVWGSAADNVWAVGQGGCLFHREGTVWKQSLNPTGTQDLHGIWGTAWNDLFAVGSGGTILHMNGTMWKPMTVPNTVANVTFQAVSGVKGGDVWAVGTGGTILRYHAGSWGPASSPGTQTLFGVAAGGDPLIVGESGFIAALLSPTYTAWQSWSNPRPGFGLSAVTRGGSQAFAVGVTRTILRWDGLATLFDESGGLTSEDLSGVWASTGGEVIAVGASGSILRRSGSTWHTVVQLGGYNLNGVWGAPTGELFIVGSTAGSQGVRVEGRWDTP